MRANDKVLERRRPGAAAAVTALILGALSCSLQTGPGDITTLPARDYQVISRDENPSVTFSYPVIPEEAEDLLSVQHAGTAVAGRHTWDGETLSYIPHTPFTPGKRYVLVFEGACADESGRDHQYHRYIPFYRETGEFRAFYLSEAAPPSGSFIDTRQEIRLTFSDPVDGDTVETAFSITPDIPLTSALSGETLVITPEKPLPDGKTVTLSFPAEGLYSTSGTSLEEDTEIVYRVQEHPDNPAVESFTPCIDAPELSWPEVPGADPAALAGDEVFRLRFDRGMDRPSVEGAAAFEPDLPLDFLWEDEASVLILPDRPLTPETSYRFTLAAEAADTGGLCLGEPFTAETASAAPFLRVEQMEFLNDGLILTSFDRDTAQTISLGPGGTDYMTALNFSLPLTSQEERQNAQENIVFSCIFPPAAGSPVPVSYTWESSSRLIIGYSALAPSGPEEDRYYLFSVSGGPEGVSIRGGTSCLEEDISQLIRSIE